MAIYLQEENKQLYPANENVFGDYYSHSEEKYGYRYKLIE